MKDSDTEVGNIYLGYVDNIVPNIHAAFVRFHKDRIGYLPLEHVHPLSVINRQLQGKKELKRGDFVIVQVDVDAVKTKQPHLTSMISLPGSYCVLSLGWHKMGCSRKLEEEKRRELIRNVRNKFRFPEDLSADLLLRTEAGSEEVTTADILNEADQLTSQLREILERAKGARPGTELQLASGSGRMEKRITDLYHFLASNTEEHSIEILTDVENLYQELSESDLCRKHEDISLRYLKEEQGSLTVLYGIPGQLKELEQKIVWLKSGAYLVLEPTEAMNVIDVNSGKAIHAKGDVFLDINMEAAMEIIRQIRLREYTGMILVDFINMSGDHEEYARLEELLNMELAKDPVHTKFIDFTPLGIAEIIRSKTN